jgi:hypothetical protein
VEMAAQAKAAIQAAAAAAAARLQTGVLWSAPKRVMAVQEVRTRYLECR